MGTGCQILTRLSDAPSLHKGVEAENNQEHREACEENETDQTHRGKLEVELPLREGSGRPGHGERQKRQPYQRVEQTLSMAKIVRK